MQVATGIPVHASDARYGPVATMDTMPVVQAPALGAPVGLPPRQTGGCAPEAGRWSTGLFDCFEDMETCCYGMWCTPCLFGDNIQSLDASGSCPLCCISFWGVSQLTGGPCLLSGPKRTKLRAAYGLPPSDVCCCGEEFDDMAIHCLPCTMPCALCQEYRELRARGACSDRPACATGSALPVISTPPQPVGTVVEMLPVVGVPSAPHIPLGVPVASASYATAYGGE